MTKIRFRDLTEAQKEFIVNGCGGKGSPFKPPKFIEFACCDHHDFNYWLGYREKDRNKADVQFYDAMMVDVSNQSFLVMPLRYAQARLYYIFVRLFGEKYFHYSHRERTLEDLETQINGNS